MEQQRPPSCPTAQSTDQPLQYVELKEYKKELEITLTAKAEAEEAGRPHFLTVRALVPACVRACIRAHCGCHVAGLTLRWRPLPCNVQP